MSESTVIVLLLICCNIHNGLGNVLFVYKMIVKSSTNKGSGGSRCILNTLSVNYPGKYHNRFWHSSNITSLHKCKSDKGCVCVRYIIKQNHDVVQTRNPYIANTRVNIAKKFGAVYFFSIVSKIKIIHGNSLIESRATDFLKSKQRW